MKSFDLGDRFYSRAKTKLSQELNICLRVFDKTLAQDFRVTSNMRIFCGLLHKSEGEFVVKPILLVSSFQLGQS